MLKFASTAVYLLALNPLSVEGFSLVGSKQSLNSLIQSSPFLAPAITPRNNLVLNAADGSETGEEEFTEEASNELTDDEPDEASSGMEEEDEEVDEEVDEELEAVKKEIAELESKLKNKNRELDSIEKMGEQYTAGGYARKVAETEQYRKSKYAASADGKVIAKASVLQNFLPIVDELNSLTEKYDGDDFAKKYAALSWDFTNALKDMGVTEYSVAEGDASDARRVNAVEEEYSESIAKGCVIKALNTGYEIDGNVMRMADAVVSLGSETEDTEEEVNEAGEAENE